MSTSESTSESTYDVVLLVEQVLSAADAAQVWSLHSEIDEQVSYHVLQPIENAAAAIESGIGSLGAGEVMAAPNLMISGEDLVAMQKDAEQTCRDNIAASVAALVAAGARASGEPISVEPIEALIAKVKDVDAREALILTRPHVVAEFFHVDWASRARRKLGVPVLHLLEHENFDEQAGQGEGITGL